MSEPIGARALDLVNRRAAKLKADEIKNDVEKLTKEMLVGVEKVWTENPELESVEVWGLLSEPFEIGNPAALVSTYALSFPGTIEAIVRNYGYTIVWKDGISGDVHDYHGKHVFTITM